MDGIWTHIWAMLETIFLLHQLAITEVRLLRISSPGVEVSSPSWNLTQITAASGKYSWCSFLHPTPTAPTPLASFYFLRLLSYGMVQIYTKVEWYNDVRVISPTFKKYHLLASLISSYIPTYFPPCPVSCWFICNYFSIQLPISGTISPSGADIEVFFILKSPVFIWLDTAQDVFVEWMSDWVLCGAISSCLVYLTAFKSVPKEFCFSAGPALQLALLSGMLLRLHVCENFSVAIIWDFLGGR